MPIRSRSQYGVRLPARTGKEEECDTALRETRDEDLNRAQHLLHACLQHTTSVLIPSLRHSAATSSASCAAFCSGLLAYLLLPMHSATWLGSAAGALKVTMLRMVIDADKQHPRAPQLVTF